MASQSMDLAPGADVGLTSDDPWPGLAAFTEGDAGYFAARDGERDELLDRVLQNRLTVLHGLSGLGKTSLLQAGLFPALRPRQFFPIYVRLNFGPDGVHLIDQLFAAIQECAIKIQAKVPSREGRETPWEYFYRQGNRFWNQRSRLITPVLVFDQFEEIFTLGSMRRPDQSREFVEAIADLAEGRAPLHIKLQIDQAPIQSDRAFDFSRQACRVLFSLRDEYVAYLDDLRGHMPTLLYNRMRLRPFNGTQARTAVLKPGVKLVTETVANLIVGLVTSSRDVTRQLDEQQIDPALLSLLCRELNKSRIAAGEAQISPESLSRQQGVQILAAFYEGAVRKVSSETRRFVEQKLLLSSRQRDSVALETAIEAGVRPDEIETLVEERLLRKEERGGIVRLELTHDVLIDVVAASRDKYLIRRGGLMNLPEYDELYVVSDLHMGGRPGFQIMREGKRLAGFVEWVGRQRPEGRVALLLNGDVIDSLAEDIGGYVAVADALALMQRIFAYDTFKPVWDALAAFVAKPRRTLIIVIGNHDIELAFAPVQRAILQRLAGGNLAARACIEFSTMGAGYSCVIGNATVFCTHGNEVDPWNYVRYEDLSRAARRLNAGRTLAPSEWQPNAGTRMVKDVMNEVKRKYAWIDLLKPEAQAAVGVLLVLDPTQLTKISGLIPIIGEKVRGDQQVEKRLSADGFATSVPVASFTPRADQLLGSNLTRGMTGGSPSGLELLLEVEKKYQAGGPGAKGGDETLGTGQFVLDRLTGWITGMTEDEALRRALKDWLAGDKTFQVDAPDDTYKSITESTGADIDFIVTGHTHLERAINRGGGRYYFNTGTWIRLLRFDDSVLASAATFAPVYKVLLDGTMKAIDDAVFGGKPFVMDQCSAVRIRADNAGAVGELVHVTGDGTQSSPVGAPFRRQ